MELIAMDSQVLEKIDFISQLNDLLEKNIEIITNIILIVAQVNQNYFKKILFYLISESKLSRIILELLYRLMKLCDIDSFFIEAFLLRNIKETKNEIDEHKQLQNLRLLSKFILELIDRNMLKSQSIKNNWEEIVIKMKDNEDIYEVLVNVWKKL